MLASWWRYKWLIVAAALTAAVIVYGVSLLQDTLYRAEGTVLLSDTGLSLGVADEIGLIVDPRRSVPNQVKIIESAQVAQRAAQNLGNGITTTDVQDATSAAPAADLGAIEVTGTMPTASQTVGMVDAVVGAYEEIITEQVQNEVDGSIATLEASKVETEARISELDAQIAENPDDSALQARRTAAIEQFVALDTRIELLATNAALYGSGVQLYVAPDPPDAPIQPKPTRNAAIAFVVAALGAGALAKWRAEQYQIADNRNAPALAIGAPLLASIPDFEAVNVSGPAPAATAPESEAAEAYHFALSSIGFALEGIDGKSVLITSTSPGDGKSATAINLAIVAAQDGRAILLIDADERAQGLTRLANLLEKPGISDLNGPTRVERSLHQWTMDDGTSLDFVPAGRGVDGNTATFFRSDKFNAALDRLVKDREMVILDSPPVMAAAETTDIGAAVDAIVLVVQQGTPLRHIEDARDRLLMSGTPIVGYIFNRATPKSRMDGYGYGYGYGNQK